MNIKQFAHLMPILVMLILSAAACGQTPEEGICGDEVCDEAEQANPALCPQDCAGGGGGGGGDDDSSSDDGTSGGDDWWAEVTWGCDLTENGEDHWTVDIIYEFNVGSDDQIRGSGTGEGRQVSCTRPGCESCSLTLDPFTVSISGLKQDEYFSIQMDPEYNMEQYLTCNGVTNGGRVYQLDLCKCQPGGPHDITIEAEEGGYTEFECPVPGGTAMGWITIHQGEP
ncbi:MAG: hypothetical protein AB1531_10885 [Chloroflexota bacterium]